MNTDPDGTVSAISTELFESHRSRLQGVAYGMLGSVMEAEDTVQDAYLRWMTVDVAQIDSPAAYLTTITTRIAIDRLRSARVRRETYVGPWLPEPLITEFAPDPADVIGVAERLSLALVTALERLNPIERAILLLREVFDMDYIEIADVVDKSPTNCRQIAARARRHVGDPKRHRDLDPETEMTLLSAYLEALAAGDVDRLATVFSEDVVLWADGGGKVRAARHLLHGAHRVARHLIGVTPQITPETEVTIVRANGDPAFLASVSGEATGLIAFEIAEASVIGIRAIINPDKLAHITP